MSYYNQPGYPQQQPIKPGNSRANSSFSHNQQSFYGHNPPNFYDRNYNNQNQDNQNILNQQSYYRNTQNYNCYNYQNNNYYNNNSSHNNNTGFESKGNYGKDKLNASVSYNPNLSYSLNNSFASEKGYNGMAQVGRFGGPKKKNRDECNQSISSNTQSKKSTEPKVKQPTVKEESSNEFYFPIHTEVTSFVTCPFNQNHMMEESHLMTHINKCKLKSENAKYFSVCPYDPCHYFFNTAIEQHILNCDKRYLFVVPDQNQAILNSSTASSIPSVTETELFLDSKKSPESKIENNEKKDYEEFFVFNV